MSNSNGDIAMQIKAMFNRRKDFLKEKKKKNIFICVCLVISLIAIGLAIRTKVVRIEYAKKEEALLKQQEDLLKQKEMIEQQIASIEIEREKANEELYNSLTDAEMVAKNNLYLVEQNIKLQNALKEAASVGVKPRNYNIADEVNEAIDFSKLEYVGEFEGTAYTPTAEECGNNLGYTASGKPIIAGVSIAVDNKYWKMGTKFYIEGLGYVIAMDTGSAVKGKYRFDYAVFDRDYAFQIGRRKYKVYMVIESGD